MKLNTNLFLLFAGILFLANPYNLLAQDQVEATAKVLGNCDMCKATIEQAGSIDDVATVVWDKESKIATISYDASKTSKEEILQQIADAGYDNELYTASTEAYNELSGCCKYDRDLASDSSAAPKACCKGKAGCTKEQANMEGKDCAGKDSKKCQPESCKKERSK